MTPAARRNRLLDGEQDGLQATYHRKILDNQRGAQESLIATGMCFCARPISTGSLAPNRQDIRILDIGYLAPASRHFKLSKVKFSLITDRQESCAAYQAAEHGFAVGATLFPDHFLGWQGGGGYFAVYWHAVLGIWGVFRPEPPISKIDRDTGLPSACKTRRTIRGSRSRSKRTLRMRGLTGVWQGHFSDPTPGPCTLRIPAAWAADARGSDNARSWSSIARHTKSTCRSGTPR